MIYSFYGFDLSYFNLLASGNLKQFVEGKLPRNKDIFASRRLLKGYRNIAKRIDRLLPKGHRWRGDVA